MLGTQLEWLFEECEPRTHDSTVEARVIELICDGGGASRSFLRRYA